MTKPSPPPRHGCRSRCRVLCAALGLLATSLLVAPQGSAAQALLVSPPEQAGLSPAGLAKVGEWMRAEVADKKIPGAVLMIWRGGKLAYVETVGRAIRRRMHR